MQDNSIFFASRPQDESLDAATGEHWSPDEAYVDVLASGHCESGSLGDTAFISECNFTDDGYPRNYFLLFGYGTYAAVVV